LDLWHKGELHQDEPDETVKRATKSSLTDIETKAIDQLFQLSEAKDATGTLQVYNELNEIECNNVWAKLPYDTRNYISEIMK